MAVITPHQVPQTDYSLEDVGGICVGKRDYQAGRRGTEMLIRRQPHWEFLTSQETLFALAQ